MIATLRKWQLILIITCCFTYINTVVAAEKSVAKAAFIEKLIRYIEWPIDDNGEENTNFNLCISGDDDLEGALDQLASITQVKDKPLAIHYLSHRDNIKICKALYISSSTENRVTDLLEKIKNLPILTIADTEGYASKGVMINFFIDAGRLRFEINPRAVKKAGIKVSARVLKLARIVDSSKN